MSAEPGAPDAGGNLRFDPGAKLRKGGGSTARSASARRPTIKEHPESGGGGNRSQKLRTSTI